MRVRRTVSLGWAERQSVRDGAGDEGEEGEVGMDGEAGCSRRGWR